VRAAAVSAYVRLTSVEGDIINRREERQICPAILHSGPHF